MYLSKTLSKSFNFRHGLNSALHYEKHCYSSCYYLNRPLVTVPDSSKQIYFQNKRCFSLESVGNFYTSVFQSISESSACAKTHDILLFIHDTTGLPWWASITLTTVCLRLLITFPLAVYQSYITAKLELCKVEMDDLVKELRKETAVAIKMFNWTEKEAKAAYNRSLKTQWKKLIVRENCHPFKTTLVFWFQVPLWITLSVTLRNIVYRSKETIDAQLLALQFSVGGVYWAPNLFLPDHSLVLPIALGILNLGIIELQVLTRTNEPSRLQRYLTNTFRGLAVVMVPVAASVPSCLSLYWVSSSLFGLIQNLILMSPKVKRTLFLPKTPSEPEHPYKSAMLAMKSRWYFKPFK